MTDEKERTQKGFPSLPFIEADVELLSTEQGGRLGPIADDYRPDCRIGTQPDGGPIYLGVHVYLLDQDLLRPGELGRARLYPRHPEFATGMVRGQRLELCEGPHVIGTATVTHPLPSLAFLIVELDPPGEPPIAFGGDTAPLVYFLSFAFATRYGAQHELSKAAALLRDKHKIDLKPLLTFADRAAEDEADRAELERMWQDAAPLAETCRAVTAAIDADATIRELLAGFPTLRDRIEELGRIATWAAESGWRLRLTFEMD